MKEFFGKIKAWIIGHKLVSIIIASVLVVGIGCAIVLPIALKEDHTFGTELEYDDTYHYYACECGEKKGKEKHDYSLRVTDEDFLKASATTTSKAQYWKSCKCGKASNNVYFETGKFDTRIWNVQDLSKVFDWEEVANPTYSTNSDGEVAIEWYQGDAKLDSRPINSGTYKVKISIAENDTYAGVSAEKEFTISKKQISIPILEKEYDGNDEFEFKFTEPGREDIIFNIKIGNANAGVYDNQPITYVVNNTNYEVSKTTVNAKINKRPVWAENVKFTYGNCVVWTGEEAIEEVVIQNVLEGESIDCSMVEWKFSAKDVGSALEGIKFLDGNDGRANYEFVLHDSSATIIPKVVDDFTYAFEYNGTAHRVVTLVGDATNDIINGDQVEFEAKFETSNAGAKLDLSFEPGFVGNNYVLGEGANVTLVKKVVSELPLVIETEYNGISGTTDGLVANLEIDGVQATLLFTAYKSDGINKIYAPGRYEGVSLAEASLGENFDLNIDYNDKHSIVVNAKSMPTLDLKVTVDTYNLGEITLLGKDGILSDEGSITVTISKDNASGVRVGAVYDLIIDEQYSATGKELVGYKDESIAEYYRFVPDENGVIGTLTIVEDCDVQFDGSCACGKEHEVSTSLSNAYVFKCQTAEKITFDVSAGQKLYFKVMGGSNSKLNDFYFKADEGSTATFKYVTHSLTAATPSDEGLPVVTEMYSDVADTWDFYLVITCVTSGRVVITVE